MRNVPTGNLTSLEAYPVMVITMVRVPRTKGLIVMMVKTEVLHQLGRLCGGL